MIFAVPSYGRAGLVSEFVIEYLSSLGDVHLFVRENQRAMYRAAYPHISIMGVPNKCNTIAKTRAFMCKDIDTAVWAMVDDDITSLCIKHGDTRKFGGVKRATIAEARPYIRAIEDELKYLPGPHQVGVIGLPDRVTLARPHNSYSSALPVRQFVFMNRAAAKAARYTMPLLSDIDCCLHWLTYNRAVVRNHSQLGQASPPTAKTQAKGGCGEYREKNPTYYIDGYTELEKRWPGIVSAKVVYEKGVMHLKKRIAWSKVR